MVQLDAEVATKKDTTNAVAPNFKLKSQRTLMVTKRNKQNVKKHTQHLASVDTAKNQDTIKEPVQRKVFECCR